MLIREMIVSTLVLGSGHLLLPGVLAWMQALRAWPAISEVSKGTVLVMAGLRLAAHSVPAVGWMLALPCCLLLAALGCMRAAGNHWSSTELVM